MWMITGGPPHFWRIAEIRLSIRVNGLEPHGAYLSIVLDAKMPQQKSANLWRCAVQSKSEQIAILESLELAWFILVYFMHYVAGQPIKSIHVN